MIKSNKNFGLKVASVCIGLTVFFGAQVWAQTTKLGQFLDPLADKLLVASTLLMLAGFGRISHFTLMPAVIILCREIMVSGLRECLSELKVNMPVTTFAKWKTAVQMIAISLLLLGDTPTFGTPLPVSSSATIPETEP